MRFNSLTIDNFYANPDEVREFAFKQEFMVRGNHQGKKSYIIFKKMHDRRPFQIFFYTER